MLPINYKPRRSQGKTKEGEESHPGRSRFRVSRNDPSGPTNPGNPTTQAQFFKFSLVSFHWAVAAALLIGFGVVYQVNRVILRDYYRVRILDRTPEFVDAGELKECGDSNPVRLIVYQSTTPCGKCPDLEKEILSHVSKDFPENVCIHVHVIDPPPGEPLPLLVLISATERMVLTGRFRYEELEVHLAPFVARSPGGTR